MIYYNSHTLISILKKIKDLLHKNNYNYNNIYSNLKHNNKCIKEYVNKFILLTII